MVNKITIMDVIEPFLNKPHEKLHLAQISKTIHEPHPTVRQWLNLLENKGVLKKQYQGRLTLYSLNLENKNIIDYLLIAEKNRLIKRCEEWLLLGELVNFLQRNANENTQVLIFGSAAEYKSLPNDIDLLVIGDIDTAKVKDIGSRLNKELHIINVKKSTAISKALKQEIVKKHLIIKGSENILGWLLWQN